MRAFYSAETIANNFAIVTTYEIDGRDVALIVGQENSFVISAIDQRAQEKHGVKGHQILAVLEMRAHTVQDETQYSEAAFWQAEDFKADAMQPLMRANLAARCGITLITGDQLAKVEAAEAIQRQAAINNIIDQNRDTFERLAGVTESPEEQARRLRMYKIMRQEPPETITNE
ncbi:hypothetical protein [Citrobacter portucalensis]|uniref:hypothetical protein n=1 Tax=Citrobacter portucalensis TaxID=1639133 RepID=UPI00226BA110|nr:hypothetical protein [Citrobacter portucalensis]MCX8985167.1 hypothetical protein [Citrobacter portucalensis]